MFKLKKYFIQSYIYAQNTKKISTSIINKGYSNKNITISLYQNTVLQYKTDITLNANGIQNIKLPL